MNYKLEWRKSKVDVQTFEETLLLLESPANHPDTEYAKRETSSWKYGFLRQIQWLFSVWR